MEIKTFAATLTEHRREIVRQWHKRVLQTYPESTFNFLSREMDPFRNPVGHTLQENLASLFDGLIHPTEITPLTPALENIVKIRALQDFTMGQATAFPYLLKQVIRAECADDIARYPAEVSALESRIDALARLAVDLYEKCREQMHESKEREIRRQSFVLERAHQKDQSGAR